jgi:hypothetical protein
MGDTDRLNSILEGLLTTESLSNILDLVEEAEVLGRKAMIPVCVGLARIADDRLYEQQEFRSFSEFTRRKWGMPTSTGANSRRLGAVIIRYKNILSDWLTEPDCDPGKVVYLPQAVENHGISCEVVENLRNMPVRAFSTWAETDPDVCAVELLPERIDPETLEQVRTRCIEKQIDVNVLGEAYSVEEESSDAILDRTTLTESAASEVVQLLQEGGVLSPRKAVRVAPQVGSQTFQRLLNAADKEETESLLRAYSESSGEETRHLAPLVSREDKERLETLALKAGIRNSSVTGLSPIFRVVSEADPNLSPLLTIRTDFN